MEPVFPWRAQGEQVEPITFHTAMHTTRGSTAAVFAHPRVVIPVFPGNNCEYDSAAAFERAGAIVTTLVINNLPPQAITESTALLAREIRRSQIVMLPGGFSGGDEPDGSAKFITAFFRSPEVTDAVRELLQSNDGLMLGICNGFQALVKLGLVPFGDIRPMDTSYPTLTYNTIGRHQSRLVHTRVASDLSQWFPAARLATSIPSLFRMVKGVLSQATTCCNGLLLQDKSPHSMWTHRVYLRWILMSTPTARCWP